MTDNKDNNNDVKYCGNCGRRLILQDHAPSWWYYKCECGIVGYMGKRPFVITDEHIDPK